MNILSSEQYRRKKETWRQIRTCSLSFITVARLLGTTRGPAEYCEGSCVSHDEETEDNE